MFDKTVIVRGNTEYVPYEKKVTVHEHKAPTDDSIRMFDEMKQRAYGSILATINVSDNTLNMTAQVFKDFSSNELKCWYRLILNGKEHKGRVDLSVDQFELKGREYVIDTLLEGIAKEISLMLTKLMVADRNLKYATPQRQALIPNNHDV